MQALSFRNCVFGDPSTWSWHPSVGFFLAPHDVALGRVLDTVRVMDSGSLYAASSPRSPVWCAAPPPVAGEGLPAQSALCPPVCSRAPWALCSLVVLLQPTLFCPFTHVSVTVDWSFCSHVVIHRACPVLWPCFH